MTGPKPPIEALDEQERELARVLRALPGGEPPPALDQKILRAAANAAASSRRPRAKWLASVGSLWGIGGAAAAVLALGISWQILDPTRPDSLPRSKPAPAASSEDSMVTVDLGAATEMQDEAAPVATAPVPEPASEPKTPAAPARKNAAIAAPLARDTGASAAAERRSEAALAPAAPQAAPPAAVVAGSGINAIDVASVESDAVLTAEQFAAPAADQARAQSEASAGVLAKARQASAEAKAMTPAAWLAKIRSLRDEGRLAEARASLELFHRYYPQYVIPADLAPLQRE